MATKQQIKDMADRLVTTLNTAMPAEQADPIVRKVAEELYQIAGIPGKILPKNYSVMHGGFGKNGKRAAIHNVEYEFKPQEEVNNAG